jgi:hypothetical protein
MLYARAGAYNMGTFLIYAGEQNVSTSQVLLAIEANKLITRLYRYGRRNEAERPRVARIITRASLRAQRRHLVAVRLVGYDY